MGRRRAADDGWFFEPPLLRERAALYERNAARAYSPEFAAAWREKARTLRFRANALDNARKEA